VAQLTQHGGTEATLRALARRSECDIVDEIRGISSTLNRRLRWLAAQILAREDDADSRQILIDFLLDTKSPNPSAVSTYGNFPEPERWLRTMCTLAGSASPSTLQNLYEIASILADRCYPDPSLLPRTETFNVLSQLTAGLIRQSHEPAGERRSGTDDDSGRFDAQEPVVLLFLGRNSAGHEIYNYLELSVHLVPELVSRLEARESFRLSEYGNIIAAGLGEPSPETKRDIEKRVPFIEYWDGPDPV
jgi:hypothetical protein